MPIRIDTTRQTLADTYVTLGTFFGLATADPGTTAAPNHEASGGGYARVATTWSSGTGGVRPGSPCTINADTGTYNFAILCAQATGDNMVDNCQIVPTILSSAGQIVLTPTYTQS
jgi:hypothetical protein